MTHRVSKTACAGLALLGTLMMAGCGGGASSSSTTATSGSNPYTIGGTVSGLTGSGLTLQINGSGNLAVTASGAFTFPTPLASGSTYSVSVVTQPATPSQTCTVSNGSGTIENQNVNNVGIACADKTTTTDAIGGTVIGLTGSGLVLQDNSGDNLAIAANGNFTFATGLPSGSTYAVTVLSPPVNPYEDCAVSAGSGTTAASDITNVLVSCTVNANPAYSVSGTVSGVTGTGATLVLQDNGRDNVSIAQDGPFTFPLLIPRGSAYSVSVNPVSTSQSLTCTLANANGIVSGNITNVAVTCVVNSAPPPTASLGVAVTGLTATGLVLQDNGGNNLTVAPGPNTVSASFAGTFAIGTAYVVTVLTQPAGEVCNIASGNVTAAAGVNIVNVQCAAPPTLPTPFDGPQGIIVQGSQVYLANYVNSSVLVFTEALNDANQVASLTQTAAVTANVSSPVRVAVDANGFLYVANTGTNSVTVYNSAIGYGQIATITSANVNRPLGVTVDGSGKVYVANNGSNTVSVFVPNVAGNPAAGFTEASFSPLAQDAAGNTFQAPGVLIDLSLAGTETLFLGLGPSGGGSVADYGLPLTASSAPIFDATGKNGGTPCDAPNPDGPVGIGLETSPNPTAGVPVPQYIYVDNLYNNTVYQYPVADFGPNATACPIPITNATGMNSPQGVAVDASSNVFVTNAGTTGTNANSITVYQGAASFAPTEAPYFTYTQ